VKPHWLDPSRVEVGQAWDFDCDGEYMLVVVVETREVLVAKGSPHEKVRRNANVLVIQDELVSGSGGYEGLVIGYSESHLRRNFHRVS